jgi:hypothetical protein
MDKFIENVNTTAMIIGYPVLGVILFMILWFGTRIFRDLLKILREMRYDRWKRMRVESDWDNIEASWMLELDEYDDDPVRQQTYDTIELPDISEQIQNYQEERYERPQYY